MCLMLICFTDFVYVQSAQRMGLVEAPESQLTENDWSSVKERSNKRDDSKQPCVICKDDFGKTEQVHYETQTNSF